MAEPMISRELIDNMIRGIDQRIEQLTNLTPPRDAGFLINARGLLRKLRDESENGCSREQVREQMAKIQRIVDGKAAELGIRFRRDGR